MTTPQRSPQETSELPTINPAIRFSVSRYVFSIGAFVAVALFGLISLLGLGVDLLPNFEIPTVAVTTTYSGASPDELDRDVSRKIEDAVSTLTGVSDINSTSSSGLSQVTVSFRSGTNVDSAANAVSQATAAIRAALPSGADAPVVRKFDPNAQPILDVALLGGAAQLSAVRSYADDTLKARLERVDGVADVSVSGGPERQIQVRLDPSALSAYGLSPARVTVAISASALDLPAGALTQGQSDVNFTTRNTPRSLGDVENIVVDSARNLRVRDVATVRDAGAAATSYARVNGQDAVLLSIRKASGTNSVAVSDNVRAALKGLPLPGGYRLAVASDTTRTTRATVNDTYKELLISAAAVGVVVLLFLGRLNTVFAVVLAIPISISAAPLLYGLLGFTLNIVSLLAIIVAMGIVVDDSIVVAENVQRYRDQGYGLKDSVLLGGSEVFSAVTAASFSLLAVLLPLSFIPGIIGQFFQQFGLGLAAAIALSWLEALLFLTVRMAYTPDARPLDWRGFARVLGRGGESLAWGLALYRRWPGWLTMLLVGMGTFLALRGALPAISTRAGVSVLAAVLAPLIVAFARYLFAALFGLLEALTTTLSGLTDRAVVAVQNGYARLLARALPYSPLVLLLALGFLFSVLLPLQRVGFSFTPKSDDGALSVDLSLPPGTALGATDAAASRLERALLARPEVKLVSTTVGSGGPFGGASKSQNASLAVTLIPKGERPGVDALVERERSELGKLIANVPGASLTVSADGAGPGGSSDLSLALTAPNQSVLESRNREVLQALSQDPNIASVDSSLSQTQLERVFVPDPARLAGSGLSAQDLAQALRTYNEGTQAANLRAGDDSVPIVVKLDPAYITDDQSLLAQTVASPQLGNVPLSQFGSFQLRQAPASLSRFNKAYTSTFEINLVKGGPNPFGYQRTLVDRLTKQGLLGDGVTLGNSSAFGAAGLTGNLVLYGPIVVVLAVLLNYLVLGSQFNSFRYPIYLLLPVPLAIVGALWTLGLFGVNLDVITMLGMVILIGLSTKNAILYLEFVTDRLARGVPIFEALVESARLRFRPILMTTLTVLVISLPLILGTGEGAEFRRGLGIVLMGGVLTSTILTFFVVPCVFYLFERRRFSRPKEPELPGAGQPALGAD